ncbi:MAG: MMPL family transporter [Microthrixaceae bacterium]
MLAAIPTSSPSSEETENLVHDIRDDIVPEIENGTGAEVFLTGSTASNIDISDKLSDALPLFIAMVVGLTMLLLMAVFRSILVPIKAALAILLSIASSFGVIVAIFQWGWLKDLVGIEETIPIISFLPMMMFAILFGLSMDYEVFILSRIREEYSRTGNATASVLTGLTSSARVITAAALIMVSVFGAFVLGDDPVIKMFGIGLSVAVLLDATVVRMIIVPAVMTLFGDRAWWLPAWLDRLLPDLDVEGEKLMASIEADELARLDSQLDGDGGTQPDEVLV